MKIVEHENILSPFVYQYRAQVIIIYVFILSVKIEFLPFCFKENKTRPLLYKSLVYFL